MRRHRTQTSAASNRLGAAPAALPAARLTAEELAERLNEAATSEEIRSAARRLGDAMRNEGGVADAVNRLEQLA